LGLLSVPEVPIEREASDDSTVIDAGLAMIGQDAPAVSPLQISMLAAALVNNGLLLQPKMVDAVQDSNGRWVVQNSPEDGRKIFDESVANTILSALPHDNGILEYISLVPSGSDDAFDAWYIGLSPAENPQFGAVVVLENKRDLTEVENIGRTLLSEFSFEE
jgi:peptidoglycan glycosyltransferase